MTAATNRTPSRAEVLRLAIGNALIDTFVAMPATVQTYHADDQSADLVPKQQRVLRDKDGGRHLESLPVLPHVPVLFPHQGNGFFIKHGLVKGDAVLVIVCDRDMGPFISGGGQGADKDTAVDDRVHALGGSVCIPVSFKRGGPGPFDHMAMGHNTGRQIHVKEDSVNLGSEEPSDFAALASLCDANFTKIQTYMSSHAHAGVVLAPGGTGTPVPPTPTLSKVGSTVVKSD